MAKLQEPSPEEQMPDLRSACLFNAKLRIEKDHVIVGDCKG